MSFLSKNNKIYRDVVAYYIIDGDIYQFSMRKYFTEAESKLPATEIFNKYGCHLSKYNLEYDEFAEWASQYYDNFDALPYDMNTAQEINEKDLVKAVKKIKSDFEKKFKDFPLDGTLYTSTLNHYDDMQCFQDVVKPKKKLVNESEDNIARRLIMEIESLDGKESNTKRVFIPFCRFIEYYKPGCAIKVIDSDDQFGYGACTRWFEDYFD